jgi:predicted nucleotidyltransferase
MADTEGMVTQKVSLEQAYNAINRVGELLKSDEIHKIVLFGSFAENRARYGSDIDIIVVMNDTVKFKDWEEESKMRIRFYDAISSILKDLPIDLVVMTQERFQNFLNKGSWFSKEVTKKGKVLYESAS